MLIPDFYTIQQYDSGLNQINARLLLNKDHEIYNGHFPGQPVVPGVVQLQMIKEMVEKSLETELFLNEIVTAKYLNMINPLTTKTIDIEISLKKAENTCYKIDAKISDNDIVFLKLKGFLEIKNPVDQ
jgi:3-hydroxyacyl-[acyl-carrier-protein] dehydratase